MSPGFVREKDYDDGYTRQQLEEFGLVEIDSKLQGGKKGRQFYLPRTEQNVINSDGTVYFSDSGDSSGLNATKSFAEAHNKPFLLNPTPQQLRSWLIKNNIKTLNVAGNRGSKVSEQMKDNVKQTLRKALTKVRPSEKC
jgi:pectin methylesterase-like acyl-CoA thioesterase